MVVIETTCYVAPAFVANGQPLENCARNSHMVPSSITVVANFINIDLNPMQSRRKSCSVLNEDPLFTAWDINTARANQLLEQTPIIGVYFGVPNRL